MFPMVQEPDALCQVYNCESFKWREHMCGTNQNWTMDHPRFRADANGYAGADIVGFGDERGVSGAE